MGWVIALAVIILLLILPLGASAIYNADGLLVRVIVGPFRFLVYPAQKKDRPEKKKTADPEKKSTSNAPSRKEQGGPVSDFLPLVDTALDFLGDLRRKLRVNRLELKLTLAGSDPCDLAIHYGRAWAALGNLEPQLDRLFVIKKKDLQIQCDFEEEQTRVHARLDLTITVGRLLGLVFGYGWRFVREYLNIMKLRKGGAVK